MNKEHLYTVAGLLLALVVFGGLFYAVSPGPVIKTDWLTVIFEGLFFLFVCLWNVAILPHWQSSKTLCLGSLFLFVGSYADLFDNFYIEPAWENAGIENLLLTLGAGLFALGMWFWAAEKENLLEQLRKDRDLEKALVPKLSHDLRIPLRNVGDAARRFDDDAHIGANTSQREALDAIHKGVRKSICNWKIWWRHTGSVRLSQAQANHLRHCPSLQRDQR